MSGRVGKRVLELVGVALAVALSGCFSSTDSLGNNPVTQSEEPTPPDPTSTSTGTSTPPPPPPPMLTALAPVENNYNAFRDVLGYSPDIINDHVEKVYAQLFGGDPDTESIYFELGDDEATVKDLYHYGDERTEGIGLGMLFAVELDDSDKFDKLWTHAKSKIRNASGAGEGYFPSFCDTSSTMEIACADPYGMEMFAMALIFAHDRWQKSKIDYGSDALALLDVMRHKEDQNGGIVNGVTNLFDAETHLVFDRPDIAAVFATRPSILMPAFYELWSEATGDAFFQSAADAARDFLAKASDMTTGLFPQATYFDGTPVENRDTFAPEAYRVFPNLVLDLMWTEGDAWEPNNIDRVLTFFWNQGIDDYGQEYELGGKEVVKDREAALVAVNGITALFTSISADKRKAFIQAVWDQPTPTDPPTDPKNPDARKTRYYPGLMQLFALLVLSGKMQVL